MPVTPRLLKVGTMAESMSVYLPAMVVQKILGLGRMVLFSYLIPTEEMGIWGTGVMLFVLGAPVVTLGTNQSLVRYVSLYEARGRLREFYRTVRWAVPGVILLIGAIAFALHEQALRWVILPRLEIDLSTAYQWQITFAVLANMVVTALYLNLMSFMFGMRAYRLASLTEVFFSALFTAMAAALAWGEPSAMSLLLGHLSALTVTLVGGTWLLGLGVKRLSAERGQIPTAPRPTLPSIEPGPEAEADSVAMNLPVSHEAEGDQPLDTRARGMARLLKFGVVAMIGTMVWQVAGYVSYYMTDWYFGKDEAGVFFVMMQFSQPLLFLANAAWAVLFSHVARRWEGGDRDGALFVLETAYKAITLTVMTLTILLYVTSPWWVHILQASYRPGIAYLNGLLMFFVTVSNLTMLTIPARLHERPIVIFLAALAGAVLNAVLAAWWIPAQGPIGAALAAGVGMYFGGGLVMLVYLLASGTRPHDSTYFLLGAPALLLLPGWLLGPIWAVVLPACLFSRWFFDDNQRRILGRSARRLMDSLRGRKA